MIHLRTLGTLDLRSDDGVRLGSVLAQPKRTVLLAYLTTARPRGFHRRDSLLAVFWPELDEEHARLNLRTSLHFLRCSLGSDSITGTRGGELGIAEGALSCDAVDFEVALDAGRLEEGLELYGGEFLKGLHGDGSVELERWMEDERAHLRRRAVEAALAMSSRQEAEGELRDARRWIRRAAAWTPYDEGIHRRFLELLDRSGDRGRALREHEAFASRLEQELGVVPSPETEALVAAIRERSESNNTTEMVPPIVASGAPEAPVELLSHTATARTDGARRTSLPRRRRPLLAGAVVMALSLAVFSLAVFSRRGPSAVEPERSRVLVTVLENETGDAELEPVGRMAADWIARALAETGLLRVVTPPTAFRISEIARKSAASGTTEDRARAAAIEAAGGTVVWGSVYLRGDSLLFAAQVSKAPEGELLASLEPVTAPRKDPLPGVEELGRRVTGTLAMLVDERLRRWSRYSGSPPSYEAYREFVLGLERWTHQGENPSSSDLYASAYRHYRRAAELDSTFVLPLLWALFVVPGPEAADSLLERLVPLRSSMRPLDRALLDYHLAGGGLGGRRDVQAWYTAAQRLVELAPESIFLEMAANAAWVMGRPEETIELLSRVDREQGWLRGWELHWWWLALAHLYQGEGEKALAALRQGRRRLPQNRRLINREAFVLAHLGRAEEAQARLDEVFAGPTRGLMTRVASTAGELRFHGFAAQADEAIRRVLARYEAVPLEEATVDDLRLLAEGWARAGNGTRAGNALDEAAKRGFGHVPQVLASHGVVAYLLGDEEEARRDLAGLAAIETVRHSGSLNIGAPVNFLARADIAAQLGEREEALSYLRRAVAEAQTRFRFWHSVVPEPLWHTPEVRELSCPSEAGPFLCDPGG